jgi:ATP-binding cassette subfamily A (ABC1) protein 3
MKQLVFTKTSFGVVIIFHILAGCALSSWSILGASLFRKAQLSGIAVIIVSLILAIIVQVSPPKSSAAIAILGLLFTPMNYTFQILSMAHFEKVNIPSDLTKGPPGASWNLPVIALWVFLIVQIVVDPAIGAYIEQSLYGTASKARKMNFDASVSNIDGQESGPAIKLTSFSKHYVPSWWNRRVAPMFGREKSETVVAVNDLSLNVLRGQISVLLGANGSGKSTTLDAIAGLGTITTGEIEIDGTGGLGLCPQKNVLWDELTVYEHVAIFNGLKAMGARDSKTQIEDLVRACDLEPKLHAKAKTLSGGQKRKLQLAMMFTGGSRVCCIDEVSSGLDPLSRRKIWDILLRERGIRTLLFTTHFLDEADVLSDHIAILSRGSLKADGSAAELKHKLGGGYRVQINSLPDADKQAQTGGSAELSSNIPSVTSTPSSTPLTNKIVYELEDSAEAAGFVEEVEKQGITDYSVNGPSIEDVFLKLAEEAQHEYDEENPRKSPTPAMVQAEDEHSSTDATETKKPIAELNLLDGTGTSILQQAWILFRKRVTVLKRNYIPYIALLIIPIAAAGFVMLFFKNFKALSCSPTDQVSHPDISGLSWTTKLDFVVGPPDRIDVGTLAASTGLNESAFRVVDTIDDFDKYISLNHLNVTPGGFFLADTPTFTYIGEYVLQWSVLTQNVLDQVLSGIPIATQFSVFAVPFAPSAGKTLQAIFYFGLAMCAYPGFFALYPTAERLRKVRALHYSNGIRAAPLWLAYTAFDFIFVLLISIIAIVIWVATTSSWYHPEYLFVIFFLYGLTSILLSYVVSLFVASALAAFAWAVGIQAVLFLAYFIAYLTILTYSPTYAIDHDIVIAHFTLALITPAGNLLRALLLTLNEFSILCDGGEQKASYPGGIKVYGGPILYLIVQAIILFIFLVWWDSGYKLAFFQRRASRKAQPDIEKERSDHLTVDGVAESNSSGSEGSAGLHVQHLNKTFDGMKAVDDITFDIAPSTVFALLGPNGAGKSTTISLIRGDLHPDHYGGDVLVEGISVTRRRAEARRHLGVCPQFDAMDSMTVSEHLRFYAKARGVPDVEHNVDAIITAVGLEPYRHRFALKLSGGNKRKLSLAIALMGNPAVLLLDEPSSGMDAASKRVMWRTLEAVTKGRGMLITTHSMEEADKLADSVGIMASRMLALGTSSDLRKRFGARWYVHIVLKGAPHVSPEEAKRVKIWIEENVADALVEEGMWYGQIRFSVPAEGRSIAKLFSLLEKNKAEHGLEYYSVSQTTLDQVFLEVVTRHDVDEEGAEKGTKKKGPMHWLRRVWDNA